MVVLALIAEPCLVGQGILNHGRIHAFEVKATNAAIAANQIPIAATGRAVVVVLILDHESGRRFKVHHVNYGDG